MTTDSAGRKSRASNAEKIVNPRIGSARTLNWCRRQAAGTVLSWLAPRTYSCRRTTPEIIPSFLFLSYYRDCWPARCRWPPWSAALAVAPVSQKLFQHLQWRLSTKALLPFCSSTRTISRKLHFASCTSKEPTPWNGLGQKGKKRGSW